MDPLTITLPNNHRVKGFVDTYPLLDESAATSPPPPSLPNSLTPVLKFLGIPYASPGRWNRISEDASWEGVRECFEFGPIPFQPTGVIPLEQVWFDAPGFHPRTHIQQAEECLSVNVFRPLQIPEGTKLPVYVFIYGGALRIGCTTKTRHDPTELIRHSLALNKPIIVLTFNYRIGLLGFLNHPDLRDSAGNFGNYGLHDQLYFLQWVQRNVGSFGGDASNVTLMGNSAGAWSIAALMTRKGKEEEMLFRKVIFSSGGPATMSFRPAGSYYPYYDELLARAGVEKSASLEQRLEAIKALPASEILQFSNEYFPYGNFGATEEVGPGAVFDKASFEYFNVGDYDPHVEACLVGCVTNESTLSGHAMKMATVKGHNDYIERFPEAVHKDLFELYPLEDQDSKDIKTATGYQLLADHIFNGPSYHIAKTLSTIPNKQTGNTIPVYNFRVAEELFASRAADLGAFHTSDLALTFLTTTLWAPESSQDLTAKMWAERWIDFFYSETPGEHWLGFEEKVKKRAVVGPRGEFRTEIVGDGDKKSVLEGKRLEWWSRTLMSGGHEAIRIHAKKGDVLKAGLGETMDKMP
ncbi:hypothetical protein BP5796_06764 [Coleophoma crateriformis]|uniref:Carboxylic ester hydrolase n=1 Tax=Coleophoma crateriformis TaxID=565419 RepID=A0A3D8RPG3_9HELO|nr:hypothetical protein BP5796_06764 [Coleophoma crateriformis]